MRVEGWRTKDSVEKGKIFLQRAPFLPIFYVFFNAERGLRVGGHVTALCFSLFCRSSPGSGSGGLCPSQSVQYCIHSVFSTQKGDFDAAGTKRRTYKSF